MTTQPSWTLWPPNCCETCIGWKKSECGEYIGTCTKHDSLYAGETTDSRYRCPAFERKK
jgi:hypothetical protein